MTNGVHNVANENRSIHDASSCRVLDAMDAFRVFFERINGSQESRSLFIKIDVFGRSETMFDRGRNRQPWWKAVRGYHPTKWPNHQTYQFRISHGESRH